MAYQRIDSRIRRTDCRIYVQMRGKLKVVVIRFYKGDDPLCSQPLGIKGSDYIELVILGNAYYQIRIIELLFLPDCFIGDAGI